MLPAVLEALTPIGTCGFVAVSPWLPAGEAFGSILVTILRNNSKGDLLRASAKRTTFVRSIFSLPRAGNQTPMQSSLPELLPHHQRGIPKVNLDLVDTGELSGSVMSVAQDPIPSFWYVR